MKAELRDVQGDLTNLGGNNLNFAARPGLQPAALK